MSAPSSLPAASSAETPEAGSLFRLEALVYQRQRLWGEVLLLTPVSSRLLTAFLLLLVTLAVVYLAVGDYSRRERVKGVLKPESGAVRVFAPARGTLARLRVHVGDRVNAGQVLAEVRAARHLSDGRPLDGMLSDELAGQIARLQQSERDENTRAALDRQQWQAKKARVALAVAGLRDDETRCSDLLALAAKRRDILTPLANKGQIPRVLLENAEAEAIGRARALADVRNQLLVRAAEARELNLEAARLPLDAAARRERLAMQVSELRGRSAELAADGALVITAPVAGRVTEIYASVGQPIAVDRPLVALSAGDARLEAVLLVPSRAIGFIARGQRVQLRYEAYPQQRFGAFAASIDHVDDNLLLPAEVADPIAVNEPVYRVRARLQHDHVTAYGAALRLRPGLSFDADIVLDRRSLLRWLLDPLFSLRGRL